MQRGRHQRRHRWTPRAWDGLIAFLLAAAVIVALGAVLAPPEIQPPRAGATPAEEPGWASEPTGPPPEKASPGAPSGPQAGAQPSGHVWTPRNRSEAVSAPSRRAGAGPVAPGTPGGAVPGAPPTTTTTLPPPPKHEPPPETGPPVQACVHLPPLVDTCLGVGP